MQKKSAVYIRGDASKAEMLSAGVAYGNQPASSIRPPTSP